MRVEKELTFRILNSRSSQLEGKVNCRKFHEFIDINKCLLTIEAKKGVFHSQSIESASSYLEQMMHKEDSDQK